jgi:hypothetical protein
VKLKSVIGLLLATNLSSYGMDFLAAMAVFTRSDLNYTRLDLAVAQTAATLIAVAV